MAFSTHFFRQHRVTSCFVTRRRYLASLAFTMAVKFGDRPTIAKLTEQFDRYFDPATSRMNPGHAPGIHCF